LRSGQQLAPRHGGRYSRLAVRRLELRNFDQGEEGLRRAVPPRGEPRPAGQLLLVPTLCGDAEMNLTDLEHHVLAYYVAGHANELNVATRWYPYGELVLIIEDKITVAVRKFGPKARGKAKPAAKAFVDHMIAE